MPVARCLQVLRSYVVPEPTPIHGELSILYYYVEMQCQKLSVALGFLPLQNGAVRALYVRFSSEKVHNRQRVLLLAQEEIMVKGVAARFLMHLLLFAAQRKLRTVKFRTLRTLSTAVLDTLMHVQVRTWYEVHVRTVRTDGTIVQYILTYYCT